MEDEEMVWPFDLAASKGTRVVIDMGRMPDDPVKRAEVNQAMRLLIDNKMIEFIDGSGADKKGILDA